MINNKSVLAIITARGGSKGLPKKNIRCLNGTPLIGWTINQGIKCKYIDELIVSTDDKEIANISKSFGARVPFIRPSELASDTATSFDVVKHAIKYYEDSLNKSFDITILLEPTSPLREDDDIDKMLEKLLDNYEDFDSIISMGEVSDHPTVMKKIIANKYLPYYEGLETKSRRQDSPKAYFPYGVAYIAKTSALLSEKVFYTKRSAYYIIKRYQCYEIDDIFDFIAIEAMQKYNNNNL